MRKKIKGRKSYKTLVANGVVPSVQRVAIYEYILKHLTHPTVKEVHEALVGKMPTLSRTTVYNTLRLFSEHNVAQMITIDDHHICYDSNVTPHVHFFCKKCGKVTDLFSQETKALDEPVEIEGNKVDEICTYYKGICADCLKEAENN